MNLIIFVDSVFTPDQNYFLSSASPIYKLENFIQFLLLSLFRTSHYSGSYAMPKVFLQNIFFHSGKGAFDGMNLVQNINTILTIFNHPLYAAYLPFNSP